MGNWAMFDSMLADTGYAVAQAELPQLADRMERLESLGVERFDQDVVHSNPSDISGWIDSLIEQQTRGSPLDSQQDNTSSSPSPPSLFSSCPHDSSRIATTTSALPLHMIHTQTDDEQQDDQEANGLKLIHLLFACGACLGREDDKSAKAEEFLNQIRMLLLSMGDSAGAIGRVAAYFVEGLSRRILFGSLPAAQAEEADPAFLESFYRTCPFLKFGHFTANQAMYEELEEERSVHIIDFEFGLGVQWPPLIQMLAIRPGGPPSLRLTAIAPDHLQFQVHHTGNRLARFAASIGVDLQFQTVNSIASVLVYPGEALAVNSMLHLHRLVDDSLDSVLASVRRLSPKIFTLLEQDASHNSPDFDNRFNECLHYYSAIFDSIYQQFGQVEQAVLESEAHLGREIVNILACEGRARVERHERLEQWTRRMSGMGFKPRHLGSNAYNQAATFLTIFPGGGHTIQETAGCLTLGWQSRTLFAASAWRC
ncbi:DELLA protein GAI-like [Selaginella moellendorffii]|uniref:Putative DELLA protein n=1 Tax=Selaginella moellendorffii TaxID=88036 RepID=A9LY10_SELML|nr:DELLA protein GAI-like [Selaginella moellendorffii]ABX10759.1 putative DELLA protein [Selaginella moellendorffii]|eukprot:XP_024516667.1 DELLA protein GAI-like [Selaginella moellendorffii]